MLSNYFTFFHSAKLLNDRFTDTVVAEAYSQEKNTLTVVLYTPEPQTIVVSCAARQNYIVARSGNFRSRTNSVDLFPALIDDHLRSVVMDRTDRTVYMTLHSGSVLCIDMFGGKANAVLCDADGNVLDAFLNKRDLHGTKRTLRLPSAPLSAADFLIPQKEFHAAFDLPGKNVLQTVKTLAPKFGTTLCKEAIYRAGIDGNTVTVTAPQRDRLYVEMSSIIEALLRPTDMLEPSLYFEESSPAAFSLIPLTYYETLRRESSVDLFAVIQKFLSYGKSELSFSQKKKEVLHWLANESARTVRTITAVEKELAESSRAEQYERFGKLLMANLHLLKKGSTVAELDDTYSGGAKITIPLDASLTPVRNAERYFEKSKKSKSAREETEERLISLRQRKEELAGVQESLESVSDSISLKNFLSLHNTQLKQLGFMTEKEEEELPPFKLFTVDGGFTVYAGKSSENNDLLTVKWAKPNDLWFHARGSSGSHVVLKTGTGSGSPSKKAIEQAAAIAAYYSKMKNARNVPVAMTEKKYVRKPKGVPAGTVVIEREKVIFVTPGLPDTED